MISNCGKDERGRYSGGKAGDQSGTEWYIRSWYNHNWKCVIRFPTNVREQLALNAEKAAKNNLIGYDQNARLSYYNHLKASNWDASKITIACEADCSAGVSATLSFRVRLGGFCKSGFGTLSAISAASSNGTSSCPGNASSIASSTAVM